MQPLSPECTTKKKQSKSTHKNEKMQYVSNFYSLKV